MKAMVTGGGGFLAGHLIERLLADGHQVRTVELPYRKIEANIESNAEVIRGDLTNPDDAAVACKGMEVVFNPAALAAPFGPRELLQIGDDIEERARPDLCFRRQHVLVDESANAGTHFLHVSRYF